MKTNEQGSPLTVNTIMVVLLVVASFLIGSLWTNVQYLKKGNSGNQVANNQPAVNNPSNNPPADAQPTAVPPSADKVPKVTQDEHIKGNKSAQLAMIEYSDMECPYCKSFHPTVQKALDSYSGKVMWVYRHYPLPFHANAQKEAEASECVNELGGNNAFWKFTDAIYERTTSNGTGFALEKLAPLAKEIGVDAAKFTTCLDSGKYAKKVADQLAGGQNAGINGTPGTILVDTKTQKAKFIPGGAVPFETVKAAIDSMLEN